MRTRKNIIDLILATCSVIEDYIGLSVEPIASAADPDDKINADYQIRVLFEVHTDKDDERCLCATFQAHIQMATFQRLSDEDIVRNMESFINEYWKFQDKARKAAKDNPSDMVLGKGGWQSKHGLNADLSAGSIKAAVDDVLRKRDIPK